MTKRELIFTVILWLGLIPTFAILDFFENRLGIWFGFGACCTFFVLYRLCLDFIADRLDNRN
jgi:hypothetical protein